MAKIWTTDRLEFRRLKKELGVPAITALGILETLNIYSHKNAQDRLGVRFKPGDIPELCEWQSDPDLEAALLRHGWIIEKGGEYLIADYGTDLPDFVRKRIARQSTPENDCPDNVRKMSGQCPPREEKDRKEKYKKADPIRSESDPESVRFGSVGFSHVNDSGPEHVGAIAAALVAAHPPDEVKTLLPQKIMNLTKEPPEYLAWWVETVQRLDSVGELQILRDAANHVKSPEGGGIKKPAAYLAKQCQEALKRHGLYLPHKPEGGEDVIPF